MKKYQNVAKQFEKTIQKLENKNKNILDLAEQGANKTRKVLNELRDVVIAEGFNNVKDEIHFFKKTKPKILKYFIYFLKILSIESKRPLGISKSQIKYLNTQINRLQTYFQENSEFYNYYRRGKTSFDEHYFVRNQAQKNQVHIDTFYFFIDKQFSTSRDTMVATIMAYESLIEYLKQEISKLKSNSNTMIASNEKVSKLNWTGSKTDAVELIYALHAAGMINNGNSDINELKEAFEEFFGVKIGDPYRTFLNIRIRKINRAKLLDFLKESLLKYIEKLDE